MRADQARLETDVGTPTKGEGSCSALIWFARVVAGVTFFLIVAGGNVTSKGAGLAVPDWPLSFHSVNPAGWTSNMGGRVPGVRDEHFHRLVGATVGLLVIVLSLWIWRVEPRAWVRRLGFVALGGVVLQGALGGLRVILKTQWHLDEAIWFAIVHSCVAQAFFCLMISVAMVLSPSWPKGLSGADVIKDHALRHWTLLLVLTVYGQLMLGAIFRHTWQTGVGIVHICGALAVGAVLMQAASQSMARPESDRLGRLTIGLFLLYGLQIILGVAAYLLVLGMNGRDPMGGLQTYVPTLHVAVGALILGGSFALALRSFALTRRPALPCAAFSIAEVAA